jgi:hypothetical protein
MLRKKEQYLWPVVQEVLAQHHAQHAVRPCKSCGSVYAKFQGKYLFNNRVWG